MTAKMDRLFRKRANSRADGTDKPATLKKQPSQSALNDPLARQRAAAQEAFQPQSNGKGSGRVMGISDKPPSINVDIRNSLILPGLSQRFSVLLPSLHAVPESSIRSLLASQRARQDGPSLTLEEEELLIAEMRNGGLDGEDDDDWNGYDSIIDRDYSSRSLASISTGQDPSSRKITGSLSSPSLLSETDGPISAPLNQSSTWPHSPPPTSTSFSSFQTFGVGESSVKTKSYGFSGSSGFRDAEYIRKAKRSASGKGEAGSRKSDWSDAPSEVPTAGEARPDSTAGADQALTTSPHMPPVEPRSQSPSAALALSPPPPTSPPPSLPLPSPPVTAPQPPTPSRANKRKSLLAGLTPAQVKRISLALGEIEEKLNRPVVTQEKVTEEEEETLQPAGEETEYKSFGHTRQPSDAYSDTSQSTISSAFPYKDSPLSNQPKAKVESPSPSRLPPSPRSMNLHAHIARSEPSQPPLPQPIFHPAKNMNQMPRPIMTPSRTQPVRHNPSSSISQTSGQTSPSLGYIPGQPRPVRLTHHSNGSMSSRADTPTQDSPASAHSSSSPFPTTSTSSHDRAVATPSPLSGRIPALARSLSANQGDPRARPSANEHVNMHLRAQSLDTNLPPRRLSSSLGHGQSETIEEEEDYEDSPVEPEPEIRAVPARHNVADLKRQYSHSKRRSVGVQKGRQVEPESIDGEDLPTEIERSVSPAVPQIPKLADLRHRESTNSIDSAFAGASPETKWEALFPATDEASPVTVEDMDHACETLRKLSGIGKDELSTLQSRLVEKAKAERLALRGGIAESPEMPLSPSFVPTSHPPVPSLGPIITDITKTKMTSPPIPSSSTASPDMLGGPFSPSISVDGRIASPIERATILTASRRAAPPPPTVASLETPVDEVVASPTAEIDRRDLERRPSRKVAPQDDPDVRRDFEARIAAATAALNRTPSISVPLQRRNTKRGAPMVISTPTLVSSSAKINGNALTPSDSPIDSGVVKALEKASGSGSKMSMRWRKLGFKRGPSISNNQDIYNPPPSAQPALPNRLEEPIALRATSPPQLPQSAPLMAPSAYTSGNTQITSPDLNAFRFPRQEGASSLVSRSQSTTAGSSSGIRQVMGKIRRGRSDEKAHDAIPESQNEAAQPTQSAQQSQTPSDNQMEHAPSSSNDSAVAKFIEAGRAVGLNDQQLNEMLIAKGMLGQSQTSTANTPAPAALSSSSVPSRSPIMTGTSTLASTERKVSGPKSLLRSLSRSKKSKQDLKEAAADQAPEPVPRNIVVRRTLLVPQEDAVGQLAQFGSPNSQNDRSSPSQRKLSIKRKPLNLSREDHALVQSSPEAHRRKFSVATTSSVKSEDNNPGLGLLHPGNTLGQSTSSVGGASEGDTHSMARSSANGSLYDLYRNDETQETLASPTKQTPSANKRSTQAVEITEYADGKVVWSLVDALRDEDDDEEIQFGTPGNLKYPHPDSRTESLDLGRDSGRDSVGDVFSEPTALSAKTTGLTFRHRDRGPKAPRPPTDVYFTSSADVADLIDHLSSDLDASRGRIDILPHSNAPTATSSPFPYTSSNNHSPNPASTESGQFEDAPSPQRNIPHPIILPRPYKDGPLPQRQLFAQRGMGASAGVGWEEASPSAASFASSGSGIQGRKVEDRLQALLDRLKESGARGA